MKKSIEAPAQSRYMRNTLSILEPQLNSLTKMRSIEDRHGASHQGWQDLSTIGSLSRGNWATSARVLYCERLLYSVLVETTTVFLAKRA